MTKPAFISGFFLRASAAATPLRCLLCLLVLGLAAWAPSSRAAPKAAQATLSASPFVALGSSTRHPRQPRATPALSTQLKIAGIASEAYRSERYAVSVIVGGRSYSVPVMMSTAPGGSAPNLEGKNWVNIENVPWAQTEDSFSWASFDFSGGPIEVHVSKLGGQASAVEVRPKARNIQAELRGQTAVFTLNAPGKLAVDFDDDPELNHSFMLFANAPEDPALVPAAGASTVFFKTTATPISALPASASTVYFAAGVHELGYWDIPAHVTQVYLPAGSWVKGQLNVTAISKNDGRRFSLNGRGVLSGEQFSHTTNVGAGNTSNKKLLQINGTAGGRLVEGITLVNPPNHSMAGWAYAGSAVSYRNLKIIGWRHNNDGMGLAHNALVDDVFIRANDDALWLYQNNITVQNSVIWQLSNGAVFQLGWSAYANDNVTVRNIDVIHARWQKDYPGPNNGIVNYRFANSSIDVSDPRTNWLFEDIRVDDAVARVWAINMDAEHQSVLSNFVFRNWSINALSGGTDPNNAQYGNYFRSGGNAAYEGWVFDNVRIQGTLLQQDNAASLGRFSYDAGSIEFSFR